MGRLAGAGGTEAAETAGPGTRPDRRRPRSARRRSCRRIRPVALAPELRIPVNRRGEAPLGAAIGRSASPVEGTLEAGEGGGMRGPLRGTKLA